MMISYKRFLCLVCATQSGCLLCIALFWWGYFGALETTWASSIKAGYDTCMNTVLEPYTAVEFPIVTSPDSGRRFIAGVVTMRQTMHSKLPSFRSEWKDAWPELSYQVRVGFRNSYAVQGLGALASLYRLCMDALGNEQDFDYLIVFEDDGKPHPNTTWPGDLDRVLDLFEEADGSGLLLGGHHIRGYDRSALRARVRTDGLTIVKARGGFGAYAMVVPKKYLAQLACRYESALNRKYSSRLVPDQENWFLWNNLGGGGFVAAPLLVDHSQYAYSYTWKRFRKFVMQRDFWNADD